MPRADAASKRAGGVSFCPAFGDHLAMPLGRHSWPVVIVNLVDEMLVLLRGLGIHGRIRVERREGKMIVYDVIISIPGSETVASRAHTNPPKEP